MIVTPIPTAAQLRRKPGPGVDGVNAAVRAAVTKAWLAWTLKVTRQAVQYWPRVPVKYALTIEREFGVLVISFVSTSIPRRNRAEVPDGRQMRLLSVHIHAHDGC